MHITRLHNYFVLSFYRVDDDNGDDNDGDNYDSIAGS